MSWKEYNQQKSLQYFPQSVRVEKTDRMSMVMTRKFPYGSFTVDKTIVWKL